jgi:hypothetical protein
MTDTPTWHSWMAMNRRCYQPGVNDYDRYGGAGIRVCARWRGKLGFVRFLKDMGIRPPGTQLDRIKNSKGYSPVNCRWATVKQQQRNRRSNRFISFRGERITLVELSERVGINSDTLRKRIERGWPIKKAANQAIRRKQ